VLDVMTRPDNPVIGPRAFASTPEQVIHQAGAWIDGATEAGVGVCGKHFPGHGHTDVDSHFALPVCPISADELLSTHVRPFKDLAPRLDSLMTAHVLYPELDRDLPATLSPRILNGIARKYMAFDGLIFTDDLEMKALANYGTPRQVAAGSLQAGNDILLACEHPHIVEQAVAAARDASLDRAGEIACGLALQRRRSFLSKCGDDGPLSAEHRALVLGRREHRALADFFFRYAEGAELDSPVASG